MTANKIVPHLPDRSQLKPLEEEVFPAHWMVRTDRPCGLVAHADGLVGFENTNILIRVRAGESEFPLHLAPLSLLFTRGGQETYEVDGRSYVLDSGSYLLHNFGQAVRSHIHSPTPIESFTIGFWPGFAEDVLRGLVTPQDQLLDNPASPYRQPVRFFDQLYPQDARIGPHLACLVAALNTHEVTPGWLEERYYALLTTLLDVHRDIRAEIATLPALRASTRVELYQRLHRARDFMEANLYQPLTIAQIAREAWVSPYHFLRQFTQVFGETPHQYLTRRRLERAQSLLLQTDIPVTEVCALVGFTSLGSFSGLFRRRMGLSPHQFRQHHRSLR